MHAFHSHALLLHAIFSSSLHFKICLFVSGLEFLRPDLWAERSGWWQLRNKMRRRESRFSWSWLASSAGGWRGLMTQFRRRWHCLRNLFKPERPGGVVGNREPFFGKLKKPFRISLPSMPNHHKRPRFSLEPNKACLRSTRKKFFCGCENSRRRLLLPLQRINFLCRGKGKNRWKC